MRPHNRPARRHGALAPGRPGGPTAKPGRRQIAEARRLIAAHGNLNIGAALDDPNLSAAKTAFRQQRTAAGKEKGRRINQAPRFLLIHDELERTALQLLNSEQLIGMGGGNNTTQGQRNVHYRTLEPIVESRLSDTKFHASASATSWYLAGDAARGAIGVAFLRGTQTPTVQRIAPPPNYVAGGAIFQVFIDLGAAPMDHRTIQRNDA